MQGTIPYLGTFLTDLVMLDTAMKDFLDVCTSISILLFLSFLRTAAPEPGLINGELVPRASRIGCCTPRVPYRTLHPVHPLLSAHGNGPLSPCRSAGTPPLRWQRAGELGGMGAIFFCLLHTDIWLLLFQGGLINFEKRRKVRAWPWQQHSGPEGGG